MLRDRTQTAQDKIHLPLTFSILPVCLLCLQMRQRENYINWTCKGWTTSTDGYNSIHLNDNGMSASCFSQRTLTPSIITTERVISLLWDSYNSWKVFFQCRTLCRIVPGCFLYGFKHCEVFICKTSLQLSNSSGGRLRLDFIGSKTFANQRFQLKFI